MSDAPVIELRGLTKHFGEVRAVEDLDLTVEPGEVFGYLGPNGAGKSTTIRLLLGLIRPTDGKARLLGQDVTEGDGLAPVKAHVGYIPDDGAFYERISGARLLDYLGRLKGQERREELLERFPIPEDRPVREYSRGNRQKLAIVQAFMHDPAVLVMDEPTSGLDPLLQEEFYDLVEEERERGVSCFFSSHILTEVRRVCDRVAIIRDGSLVALEDIDTLLRKSGKVVDVTLVESPPVEALSFPGLAEATHREDGGYTLILTENFDGLVDVLDDYSIVDLTVRETSLQDVFMHFYDGGEAEPSVEPDADPTPFEWSSSTPEDAPDV